MRTRDIVSRAREVMGGNGILLEYDVARFVADAEASYEGTKEINSLLSADLLQALVHLCNILGWTIKVSRLI